MYEYTIKSLYTWATAGMNYYFPNYNHDGEVTKVPHTTADNDTVNNNIIGQYQVSI